MDIYAVIQTGGKQYRVSPGDVITVEKLAAQPGDRIEIDQVYLVARGGQIFAGKPGLTNTRVLAQVLAQDRAEKLLIFKHRRRKGYRKTIGHRQYVTELKIVEIVHEGVSHREQEKQDRPQKFATAPKAAPAKKERPAKQRAAVLKSSNKQPAGATKQEKGAAGSPQPEKPKPVQKPLAPAAAPPASAARPTGETVAASAIPARPTAPLPAEKPQPAERPDAPATAPKAPAEGPEAAPKKEEPKVLLAPSPEPEQPVIPAKPSAEAQPDRVEPKERPTAETSPEKRRPWWIIGAVLAALAFVALLLLLGRERPSPAPAAPHEAGSKPIPKEKTKPRPLVREGKTKETAPVGKPAAPVQPPD